MFLLAAWRRIPNLRSGAAAVTTIIQPPPPKRRRWLACAFYLTPVPANSCLVFKTSLLANAEFFGIAGTTKLGGNRVSTLGPFVSQSKFIHGIVSR